MELKAPRPKKNCKLKPCSFLSLLESANAVPKCTGMFNNFSVIIKDNEEMKKIHTTGCFGKGTLSRSYPTFHLNQTQIVRKRVFTRRKEWALNNQTDKRTKKIIVVPDSDCETEYFTNLTAEYCIDSCSLKECLHLSLEEAYFLSFYIKCLNIIYKDTVLMEDTAWKLFMNTNKYFVQNYAVYHYFRSKNWIVKPGVKFGGDYLLYREGPAFYHASYLVIIDVLDHKTLRRRTDMCRRSMDIPNIIGLNRLCETVGKELLICQIVWATETDTIEQIDLKKLSISEVIMSRWIASENRDLTE